MVTLLIKSIQVLLKNTDSLFKVCQSVELHNFTGPKKVNPNAGSLAHFNFFFLLFDRWWCWSCVVKTDMDKFGGEESLGVNITSLIIYKSFPWAQEGFILDG